MISGLARQSGSCSTFQVLVGPEGKDGLRICIDCLDGLAHRDAAAWLFSKGTCSFCDTAHEFCALRLAQPQQGSTVCADCLPVLRHNRPFVQAPHASCSFCGKRRSEVQGLIAGPNVYICESCVTVCKRIAESEFSDASDADKLPIQRRHRLAQPAEARPPAPGSLCHFCLEPSPTTRDIRPGLRICNDCTGYVLREFYRPERPKLPDADTPVDRCRACGAGESFRRIEWIVGPGFVLCVDCVRQLQEP